MVGSARRPCGCDLGGALTVIEAAAQRARALFGVVTEPITTGMPDGAQTALGHDGSSKLIRIMARSLNENPGYVHGSASGVAWRSRRSLP